MNNIDIFECLKDRNMNKKYLYYMNYRCYRRHFAISIYVELNKFCQTYNFLVPTILSEVFYFGVIVLNSYLCLRNIFCKPRDILFVILPYYMMKQSDDFNKRLFRSTKTILK